jgi:hypothetical protein
MFHRPLYDDPDHWHARGEEMLAIAEDMKDIHARAIMHRIAEDYFRLAECAQTRVDAESCDHLHFESGGRRRCSGRRLKS